VQVALEQAVVEFEPVCACMCLYGGHGAREYGAAVKVDVESGEPFAILACEHEVIVGVSALGFSFGLCVARGLLLGRLIGGILWRVYFLVESTDMLCSLGCSADDLLSVCTVVRR
jgi:hypothetical protein